MTSLQSSCVRPVNGTTCAVPQSLSPDNESRSALILRLFHLTWTCRQPHEVLTGSGLRASGQSEPTGAPVSAGWRTGVAAVGPVVVWETRPTLCSLACSHRRTSCFDECSDCRPDSVTGTYSTTCSPMCGTSRRHPESAVSYAKSGTTPLIPMAASSTSPRTRLVSWIETESKPCPPQLWWTLCAAGNRTTHSPRRRTAILTPIHPLNSSNPSHTQRLTPSHRIGDVKYSQRLDSCEPTSSTWNRSTTPMRQTAVPAGKVATTDSGLWTSPPRLTTRPVRRNRVLLIRK